MICSKNGGSAGTVGWEINFFTQNIAMLDWSVTLTYTFAYYPSPRLSWKILRFLSRIEGVNWTSWLMTPSGLTPTWLKKKVASGPSGRGSPWGKRGRNLPSKACLFALCREGMRVWVQWRNLSTISRGSSLATTPPSTLPLIFRNGIISSPSLKRAARHGHLQNQQQGESGLHKISFVSFHREEIS